MSSANGRCQPFNPHTRPASITLILPGLILRPGRDVERALGRITMSMSTSSALRIAINLSTEKRVGRTFINLDTSG
jgi:hypothetical protein